MKQVLIVTPDPETGEMLRLKCELDGLVVTQAVVIDEATSCLKSLKPDVCVIDVIGLDVVELDDTKKLLSVAHRIKSRTLLLMPCAPCIKKLPSLKADRIIKKPYDLEFFSKSIRHLCKISSPRKS